MAKIDYTARDGEHILLLNTAEVQALATMIQGASLPERRIFYPVLCKIKKMGLI